MCRSTGVPSSSYPIHAGPYPHSLAGLLSPRVCRSTGVPSRSYPIHAGPYPHSLAGLLSPRVRGATLLGADPKVDSRSIPPRRRGYPFLPLFASVSLGYTPAPAGIPPYPASPLPAPSWTTAACSSAFRCSTAAFPWGLRFLGAPLGRASTYRFCRGVFQYVLLHLGHLLGSGASWNFGAQT